MIGMDSVLIYSIFVALLVMAYWILAPAIYDLVSAVRFVRKYYRENPDVVPPDHWLVRLGLWRVR